MDDVRELGHDEVDALDAGRLESFNLLFDDGFECHVGSEETRPDAVDVLDGERDLTPQLLLVGLNLVRGQKSGE